MRICRFIRFMHRRIRISWLQWLQDGEQWLSIGIGGVRGVVAAAVRGNHLAAARSDLISVSQSPLDLSNSLLGLAATLA